MYSSRSWWSVGIVLDSNLVQLLKAMFSVWVSSKGIELATERSPWRGVEAVECLVTTDNMRKPKQKAEDSLPLESVVQRGVDRGTEWLAPDREWGGMAGQLWEDIIKEESDTQRTDSWSEGWRKRPMHLLLLTLKKNYWDQTKWGQMVMSQEEGQVRGFKNIVHNFVEKVICENASSCFDYSLPHTWFLSMCVDKTHCMLLLSV